MYLVIPRWMVPPSTLLYIIFIQLFDLFCSSTYSPVDEKEGFYAISVLNNWSTRFSKNKHRRMVNILVSIGYVSLDCPFLVVPSVFSNVYFQMLTNSNGQCFICHKCNPLIFVLSTRFNGIIFYFVHKYISKK